MESIGFPELLVILGVAVLLFGGKKIPELAKGLGEGIRNFKTALKGEPEKPPSAEVVPEVVKIDKA
jgi:sec-independent protein translocase protein TatA